MNINNKKTFFFFLSQVSSTPLENPNFIKMLRNENSLHFWGIHKTNSNQAETYDKNNIGKNYIFLFWQKYFFLISFYPSIQFFPIHVHVHDSTSCTLKSIHHSGSMTANPQLWYTTSRGMYIWEVVVFFLFFSLVEKSLNIGCWMKVSIFLSLFQAKVLRWVHITVSSAVNGSGDLWNPCVVRCGAKPARRGQEIQRHQMTLPDLICVLMRDISITFTNKDMITFLNMYKIMSAKWKWAC